MKTNSSQRYERSNERRRLLLLLIFLFVLLTGSTHAAASGDPPRYHESGKFTGIEENNTIITVIINERGYAVDPSVLVVNAADKPTTLDKLTLPADVNFEYCFIESAPKTMSPVVVYIEEAKKNGNNGRIMQ